MHFHLPPEVKQVQCHLTWIEEIIPLLEQSALDRSETLEDHIQYIKKTVGEDECDGDLDLVTDEGFEDSYNDHYPKFTSLYASRLNEAAKLAYLSEFKEARDQLVLLEALYDTLEPCHKDAFEYAVDAMKWSITVLKIVKSANSSEEEEEELEAIKEAVIFQRKWVDLQKDDKAKACLRYMWGCLGGNLKVMEHRVLSAFQEVVSLDPDYHVWYAEVYRKMRGIRRNNVRSQTGRLEKPCELEQQMCQEAYDRKPHVYLSIKNLAIMLKETLWIENKEYWDENEETYLRCWDLFNESLKIATENKQKNWTRKNQIYLAEFLLFGRGRKLDQDEGKRIFDQCFAENPNDSTVLHKAGKLCHLGAAMTRKFQNWDLAEQFYSHALKAKPTNYPCLKDYLRILVSGKKYMDYVEVIDGVVGGMKRDYQVSDLKIMRGCVIWMFNPFKDPNNREDACESWLYVLMALPHFAQNLFDKIRKPPFYLGKDKPAYINKHQLMSTLDRLKKTCKGKADSKRLSAIETFLEDAENINQEEKPFQIENRGRGRGNDRGPLRRTQNPNR